MRKLYLLLAMLLVGCVTPKDWAATGGSRSDGVVELSYQYGMFEQPKVSEAQAADIADSRCAAWGYSSAEAFGGQTRTCDSNSRCTVTHAYQCLGQPDAQ